ncbi:MAG: hypothetical protein ACTSP8_05920 [Promethearchaeota archaeon]
MKSDQKRSFEHIVQILMYSQSTITIRDYNRILSVPKLKVLTEVGDQVEKAVFK